MASFKWILKLSHALLLVTTKTSARVSCLWKRTPTPALLKKNPTKNKCTCSYRVCCTGVFASVKLKNVRKETCPYITLDVENQSVRSDCHLTCQHLFPSVTCKLKLERSRCRRQLIECIPSLSKHTQFLPHGAVSDQYSSSCSAYSPVIPSTDI